ncbi:hypothetical protein CRENPOLYSF1_50117 [Crenothrix polyspora]|uniref:Uncharacterized protein n=1 Tax=Crenothrix polyspora TaxID=360316 RepID=A0A1R4HDH7_9GAMM|nr:hypothetical protein CRENPOLYSF1_50117 [Crenothrix polyspora]
MKAIKLDNVGLNKAPVAQLDRVIGYEPIGREFESLRARQLRVKNNSPVAQQVEQVTVNHLVGGSSPSGGAKQIKGLE